MEDEELEQQNTEDGAENPQEEGGDEGANEKPKMEKVDWMKLYALAFLFDFMSMFVAILDFFLLGIATILFSLFVGLIFGSIAIQWREKLGGLSGFGFNLAVVWAIGEVPWIGAVAKLFPVWYTIMIYRSKKAYTEGALGVITNKVSGMVSDKMNKTGAVTPPTTQAPSKTEPPPTRQDSGMVLDKMYKTSAVTPPPTRQDLGFQT